jgi:hypothetical protein
MQRLGKLKEFNSLIGTETRDLPACSVVPQPHTLPRAQQRVSVAYILPNWKSTGFTIDLLYLLYIHIFTKQLIYYTIKTLRKYQLNWLSNSYLACMIYFKEAVHNIDSDCIYVALSMQ